MLASMLLLSGWRFTQQAEAMAERVAGRSRMAAWQRVQHRLATLGPTEARGYVRARAISVVKEETARLIEQEGAAVGRWRAKIEQRAIEMLVESILMRVSTPSTARAIRLAA